MMAGCDSGHSFTGSLAAGGMGIGSDQLGSNASPQAPPAGASVESEGSSPPPPGQPVGLASAGAQAGSGHTPTWKLWWLWLLVGLVILALLIWAACCIWMVLRKKRRRLRLARKAAGARSNAKYSPPHLNTIQMLESNLDQWPGEGWQGGWGATFSCMLTCTLHG